MTWMLSLAFTILAGIIFSLLNLSSFQGAEDKTALAEWEKTYLEPYLETLPQEEYKIVEHKLHPTYGELWFKIDGTVKYITFNLDSISTGKDYKVSLVDTPESLGLGLKVEKVHLPTK